MPQPLADDAALIADFDAQMHECFRRGITDVAVMRSHAGQHLGFLWGDLREYREKAREALYLRSASWDEKYAQWRAAHDCAPLTPADKERCDAQDYRQWSETRANARRRCVETIKAIRRTLWVLAHLHRPDVVAEIAEGPGYEYLHWRKDGRYKEAAVLDAQRRLVAAVFHVGGPGPTLKAVIFAPPFLPDMPPTARAAWSGRPNLTYCNFRQRKQAIKWLVSELDKRCIAIWGNGINLPEYPHA